MAFKPDIDDLRESPALNIARELTTLYGDSLVCVEPNVEASVDVKGVKLTRFDDAYNTAQVHVLLVDHKAFKEAKKPQGFIVNTKGIWK